MDKSILTKTLKLCIILLLIVSIYFIFRYTFSLIFPMIIVFLIAYLMEPAVKFLHTNLKLPRALASILTLLTLLLVGIGILFMVVTEIYEGIAYLAEILPEQLHQFGTIMDQFFTQRILPIYEQILLLFNQLTADDQLFVEEYITDLFKHVAGLVGMFFQSLLFAIPRNLAAIPESITVTFFILLASFLLSADYPGIKHFFAKHIPLKVSTKLQHIVYHLKKSTLGYLKAQFILVAISFHLIFLGLSIIGVKHALTIALFMILVDLIPFLGTGLLFIPWIGYSFITADYPMTIGLSIVYGIVIITRQLIEPKIYSMNMAIHPLAWLVAAFIGMRIWGVLGLLLAPFAIIILKGLIDAGLFRWLIGYINGKT